MAGTKSSGRPGGNPELKKYQFEAKGSEPQTAHLQLRVSDRLKAEIDEYLPDWREMIRIHLDKLVEAEKRARKRRLR